MRVETINYNQSTKTMALALIPVGLAVYAAWTLIYFDPHRGL